MKKFYGIISMLLILFAAPGILAYIVYQHPNWVSGRTNRGQFLASPAILHSSYQSHKWQIVYWNPQSCDPACRQRIDDLAKLRLALGRRLYYVDLVFAHSQKGVSEELQTLLHNIEGHEARIQKQDETLLGQQPAIYLVNPQHYVILAYSTEQSNQDIFHDLQKLVHDK